jgi:hypothetical protein
MSYFINVLCEGRKWDAIQRLSKMTLCKWTSYQEEVFENKGHCALNYKKKTEE